ncbi:MAG: hypothetical protein ACHQDE_02395 [Acidimicrobiia bacterium]
MAAFLSEQWIGELATAAAGLGSLGSLDAELVVDQVVRDAHGAEVRYRVRLFPGGAEVTSAATGRLADLVLVTDYPTARDLHLGRLRAQDALAAGALKVRGTPEVVARAGDALAALSAAFVTVRARTTFVPDGQEPGATEQ